MRRRYTARLFRKVLVPLVHGAESGAALSAALAIAGSEHVFIAGFVGAPDGESLSAAALPARQLRKQLRMLSGKWHLHALPRIHASHRPWNEILALVQELNPDLLVIDGSQLPVLHMTAGEALRYPPCDTIVAGGTISEAPAEVICALRGGPHAELSLRLGLGMAHTSKTHVTALHISSPAMDSSEEAAFKGVDRVLNNLPHVSRKQIKTDDPLRVIEAAADECDVLIIGATARPTDALISIGPVAEGILRQASRGVLVVKSRRPVPLNMESEAAGQTAISILVDRWFAENTYHAAEFNDLRQLLRLKNEQNLTVSLALPALNEEETIAQVVRTVQETLAKRVPILDEIVLVDSASTDRTRDIARSLQIPVYIHQEVLPEFGARSGKGEALWKSLYLTRGDIVLWVDTDIVNIHPRFIYGLLGPLIMHPEIQFIKGFYRRPLKVGDQQQAGGGGRVTELTARPLLNLFFPELSGLIQPLSGEYGGRRTALEQMPFSSGYGVEIGLLIDIFEKFGLDAIAQVDLEERIHHNQPLDSLSKMSFAIIQAVVRRIERRYGIRLLEDVNKTMKLIRYSQQRLLLDIEEIAEFERPPMIEIPQYQERPTKSA